MDENIISVNEMRTGKQFIVLFLDYFWGVIVHLMVSYVSLLYLDADLNEWVLISVLGTSVVAYLIPSFFLDGASPALALLRGRPAYKGNRLGLVRQMMHYLLYVPVMMIALYILSFNGLFNKQIPYNPLLGVRYIEK